MIEDDIITIIDEFEGEKGDVIPILQKIQEKFGYISADSVAHISKFIKISENTVYGIATFYSQFRFNEPSRHTIQVCTGTACHVRGGDILGEAVNREIGIHPGETTKDKRFSFQRVACLGCCASAPVIQIDEDIHARVSIPKLSKILDKYQ